MYALDHSKCGVPERLLYCIYQKKINTGINNNSASRAEGIPYETISSKNETPAVYKKLNGLSTDTQITDNVKYGMPKGRGRNNLPSQAKPNKRSLVFSATSKIMPHRNQKKKQTLKKTIGVSEKVKRRKTLT